MRFCSSSIHLRGRHTLATKLAIPPDKPAGARQAPTPLEVREKLGHFTQTKVT